MSWSVSAYAYYVEKSPWQIKYGRNVTTAELAKQLLANNETACGGCHKMLGLARFLEKAGADHDQLSALIHKRKRKAIKELRTSQLQDGSFSLPPRVARDLLVSRSQFSPTDGIYSTGHCLEWLATIVAEKQLSETWVMAAVEYLTKPIKRTYPDGLPEQFNTDADCIEFGNLCHALSALRVWKNRACFRQRVDERNK